jgi:hypothetical protein
MGDLEVLMVSSDFRIASSLRDDPDGVMRRVEGAGVPTMVKVEGVSMIRIVAISDDVALEIAD